MQAYNLNVSALVPVDALQWWAVDVDWGDGSFSNVSDGYCGDAGSLNGDIGSGSPTHYYAPSATSYTITACFLDNLGDCIYASPIQVTVQPAISLAGNATQVAEGVPYTLNPTTYIDANACYNWEVYWGDGCETTANSYDAVYGWLGSTMPSGVSHVYAPTQDSYTATITATVNGSQTDTAQINVQVEAPPNFTLDTNSVVAGTPFSLTPHGTFLPGGEWCINWGDDSPSNCDSFSGTPTSQDLTHVYDSTGTYEILADTIDSTYGENNYTWNVTVVTPATPPRVTLEPDCANDGLGVRHGEPHRRRQR